MICHQCFFRISKTLALALLQIVLFDHSHIVRTYDHILRRRYDRFAVAEFEDVVGGEHQESCLCSCLDRKRYVYCHLVAVEVCVERAAYERMQLDSSTLDEYGLKRLNRKSVKRRSTVEEHRMVFDNLFKYVPYVVVLSFFYTSLSALYIETVASLDESLHYKRLE